MINFNRLTLVLALACVALGGGHAAAQDLYQHHALVTCNLAPPDRGVPITTSNGVGITHRTGVGLDVVIYCSILSGGASTYFNWLKLNALDNTPNGSVTATFYRQRMAFGEFLPPEALYSVTTHDQPTVQEVGVPIDDPSALDYTLYAYYIEVRIRRTAASAQLIAYAVSLMDVL